MAPATETELKRKVTEALPRDLGKGIARLDPADLKHLGLAVGDMVEVEGKRKTVARALPAFQEHRGQERISLDGLLRENAGAALDQLVAVRKVDVPSAERVGLVAPKPLQGRDLEYIGTLLDGMPVHAGDRLRVPLFGTREAEFRVTATTPAGPVLIGPQTVLEVGRAAGGEAPRGAPGGADKRPAFEARRLSYSDIGGLKKQIGRIREIIELPLRYPEVFDRLGIDAPKGVLLYGPPGCGKTLIARAVAHETDAAFFTINGPEVIHKFYGESEGHLRKVFEEASRRAPSIIFLDEIDSIAPRRENAVGEVEKRVVAQLLALMDGLAQRQQVLVIAATNLPNALDPALRRPGRFDREIVIPIPDREGRQEVLEVHSRGMPLAGDVDVAHLAAVTHGFVGADLEALCREAAMICLRRLLPEIDFVSARIPYDRLATLEVCMADFQGALRQVEPSAIREVFVETPDVGWADVGGLGAVKQQLVESVVWPLRHPGLFARAAVRPPKGVLLSGPPGCGKTLLAKALARETEVNFLSVKGPALLSKYVGESERGVRDLFRKARQAAPCILFFDEFDALAPPRGSGGDSHVSDRVIGQLLTELDGLEELREVLVLAATNRRDGIDPAILRPGRFDLLVEIPLPDDAGRREILGIGLRGKPLGGGIDLAELARATEGFSGADLHAVCQSAGLSAVRDAVAALERGGEPAPLLVRAAHLDRAVVLVRETRGSTR